MLQEQSYCFCLRISTAPVAHCVVKRAVIISPRTSRPLAEEQPQQINTAGAFNSFAQRSPPIAVARGCERRLAVVVEEQADDFDPALLAGHEQGSESLRRLTPGIFESFTSRIFPTSAPAARRRRTASVSPSRQAYIRSLLALSCLSASTRSVSAFKSPPSTRWRSWSTLHALARELLPEGLTSSIPALRTARYSRGSTAHASIRLPKCPRTREKALQVPGQGSSGSKSQICSLSSILHDR